MAEKFGNSRWVKAGFLDDGGEGIVVGRIVFAGIGPVELCLRGGFSGDIAGKLIRFENSQFVDAEQALESLGDFECPQLGTVSLISFDPHPLLVPHPYVEWFSLAQRHYRFELAPTDAWIVQGAEREAMREDLQHLYRTLAPLLASSLSSS
ncbi:MAG: hypothetical protein D6690_01220 [Nitrospirae bacterium]|nr:MAG: hypothetical protein D6690_01220 [Nitrospirota bacterium]